MEYNKSIEGLHFFSKTSQSVHLLNINYSNNKHLSIGDHSAMLNASINNNLTKLEISCDAFFGNVEKITKMVNLEKLQNFRKIDSN